MDDYTQYYRYPETPVVVAQSHPEFLALATMRHRISNRLHNLTMQEMELVHEFIEHLKDDK